MRSALLPVVRLCLLPFPVAAGLLLVLALVSSVTSRAFHMAGDWLSDFVEEVGGY